MNGKPKESGFTNTTATPEFNEKSSTSFNLLAILAFLFGLFVLIAILSFFAWRCAKRQRDFDFETFVDEPRKSANRLHPGTVNEAMYQSEMKMKDKFGISREQVDSRKTQRTINGINETRI